MDPSEEYKHDVWDEMREQEALFQKMKKAVTEALLFVMVVQKGLTQKVIRSQPLVIQYEDAEEWPIKTLDEIANETSIKLQEALK